jgi:alkaline phosphatase D
MDRRSLVGGLAGVAVGWVAAGRTTGSAGAPRAYLSPVPFIESAEAASLSSIFSVSPTTPAQQAATYPQSVAAGDPNPNGCVIWTRVAPSAITGSSVAEVGWQIAEDDAFAHVIVQGVALVQSARDNTVKLPVQNAAMSPFTVYYYRFIFRGVPSRTGRFKTLPAPGASLALLKIGYVVCQDYSNGFYNAYEYLAQEDVDVVVHRRLHLRVHL